MAKIVGVFTGITGKVGNTIFQMMNGVQIMKTFVIPANPQSSGQTAQRGVFSAIIAGFKGIASGVIDLFWNPFTTGNKTGWGNFISRNLISMGKVAFDITDAVLTHGSLEDLGTIAGEYDTATGECDVEWEDLEYVNGNSADEVNGVVFDTDSGLIVGKLLDIAARDSEAGTIECLPGLTATSLEVFLWANDGEIASGTMTMVSTSNNATCTAPA